MERRKVVITGAASGIGRSAALRFAAEGFDVCINDINEEELKSLYEQLPAGKHLLMPGSYTDSVTMDKAEEEIEKKWGRVDVLVNCAGVSGKSDPVASSLTEWRVIFDTMIDGCILVTKLVVPFMHADGRIIHISSIHAARAERQCSSYSMAKAAINQFCRSMALELGEKNILVNAIAPGFVNTPMSIKDGENELHTPWFMDNYVNGDHLPLKRPAEPQEVAGVAFFLAGPDATYITGQVITVDGGLTITF